MLRSGEGSVRSPAPMLNHSSNTFRHVNSADVRICLTGEEPFDGVVYLTIGQRLSDLVNDDRAFIPVRRENGETVIIAKSNINSISERIAVKEDGDEEQDSSTAKSARSFDPYAVLRIAPHADLDDIRAAYKKRMKAVHPDAIAALELDEDLSRAALLVAQKVNYAYQKILRERQAGAKTDTAA
jgi:hypothetical protein